MEQDYQTVVSRILESTNGTGTIVILDGDIIAYRYALANQEIINWNNGAISVETNERRAKRQINAHIDMISAQLKSTNIIVTLSSANNFRKSVLPSYKANRKQDKPLLLNRLKKYLIKKHKAYTVYQIEADDLMGLLATDKEIKGKKILVSIDKDMATIPCLLFNPDKDTKPRRISIDTANYNLYVQTLTGDPTDGYKGIPNFGIKKATTLLHPIISTYKGKKLVEKLHEAVLNEYLNRGLTETDYVTQYTMARILRHNTK